MAEPTPQIESAIQDDPKAVSAIKRAVLAKRQGPTSRQQASFVDWQRLADELGQPFDVELIPFSKLRQMRRDPMIGLGLHYIQAPLVRAPWKIECADPQVGQFVDAALRPIYARLVFQACNMLSFGFQALAKEFKLDRPQGVYLDENGDEKPIWSEGGVDAVVWKTFVGMPPESVKPAWTPEGDFNGIIFEGEEDTGTGGVAKAISSAIAGSGNEDEPTVDLYHSLWLTNDKDSVFGCSPAGELVLTTKGYVPIEQLNPEKHLLVSFSQNKIRRGGPRNRGFGFQVGVRDYDGDLLTITAEGASESRGVTKVTPNHKLTVRWAPEAEKVWATYLMRRGDDWRIGTTRLHRDRGHACSGVGNRLQTEKADCAWVLSTHDSKAGALYDEHLWSHIYGVPELTFKSSKGSAMRQEELDSLWSLIDSSGAAKKLLADRGLLEEYPLYTRSTTGRAGRKKQHGWSVSWTCQAVNLIPGLMLLPVDPGEGQQPAWSHFTISHSTISEPVYSLEVLPHHHYVSNGVVTQNSVYGYPRISYSFRYWWSYWFRWALDDRAYERQAVPPLVGYHPEGGYKDEDGNRYDNLDVILDALGQIRSNSDVAIPSEPHEDDQGKSTSVRQWDIKYLEGGESNKDFDKSFDYMDVAKLRSVFVPEHSLIEGSGGTSCVTSDTLVDCPRDHETHPRGIPISELQQGQLVWTINEDTQIFELMPVKDVAMTRRRANLVCVKLDSGDSIRCTPDHRFMRRDGSWVEAVDLKGGDSLMPLYRDVEPRVRVDPNGYGMGGYDEANEFRHVARAKWGDEALEGMHVHHVDGRHANTLDVNLDLLTPADHTSLTWKGHSKTEAIKRKISESNLRHYEMMRRGQPVDNETGKIKRPKKIITKLADMTPDEYAAWCKERTRKAQASWTPEMRSAMAKKGAETKRLKGTDKWTPETRAKVSATWAKKRAEAEAAGLPITKRRRRDNHKVLSVESCGRDDVWDLSIDGPEANHNFVSAGVVLHNSRNVAAEMTETFEASQTNLMSEIDDHINRYMIPQLVLVNFPEFVGECKKVTTGFSSDDISFMKQVVQLIGNDDWRELGLNVREAMERVGLPVLTPSEIRDERQRLITESALTQPPATPGIPGEAAGVVQDESFTAGFAYVDPGETGILLSDDARFLTRLPATDHFKDPTVRSATAKIQSQWADRYSTVYEDFGEYVRKALSEVQLATEDEDSPAAEIGTVAVSAILAKQLAEKIVEAWQLPAKGAKALSSSFLKLIRVIIGRSAEIEQSNAKMETQTLAEKQVEAWSNERLGWLVATTEATTRKQLARFVADQIEEGKTPNEIADAVRQHFVVESDFANWRSDQLARTEAQTAYNTGTIFAAQAVKRQLLAHDASDGADKTTDLECQERNGKIFNPPEAIRNNEDEHPRGTLYFTIWNAPDVTQVEASAEDMDGLLARYDPDTQVVYLADTIWDNQREGYMITLHDSLREDD